MSIDSWVYAMRMFDDMFVFFTSVEVIQGVPLVSAIIFVLVIGYLINALANKEP